MRLYDNDAYREKFMQVAYDLLSGDGTNDRANQIIEAFDAVPCVDAEVLLPNEPLTSDELRKMAGKPVYIIDNECGYDGRWVIWDGRHNEFWLRGHNADTYGVSWRAYRHEPEESQGGEER